MRNIDVLSFHGIAHTLASSVTAAGQAQRRWRPASPICIARRAGSSSGILLSFRRILPIYLSAFINNVLSPMFYQHIFSPHVSAYGGSPRSLTFLCRHVRHPRLLRLGFAREDSHGLLSSRAMAAGDSLFAFGEARSFFQRIEQFVFQDQCDGDGEKRRRVPFTQ